MANFNTPVDKTNDPSYLGFSRGTDNASLQQLASVPELNTKYVQPDYKVNTSFGKLFEGLGQVGTDALKFADDIVKNNINQDITKGVSAIRDSFGVAAAAENADLARKIGQGGAEDAPTSLSPGGGGGPLIPQDSNIPLPLQRLGTRLEGLKEQYSQGNLSDSAYYAKQEAFVREVKSRYPGYEDTVDKLVENKLGVNPANAVRKAIQNDVEKLANKIQAQNDKTQTWIRQNASTISTVYGGFENFQKGLADGSLKLPQVEAKVANYNSKIEDDKAKVSSIALEEADRNIAGKKAADVTTIGMTRVVDQASLAVMQQFKVKDLGEIADLIRSGKRPLPTPDEKMALQSQWSLLHEKVNTALDNYLDQPVFDAHHNTVTRRSLIGDQSKINLMKQGAMAQLDGMGKTIFGNEAPSLMQYDATLAKARTEATVNDVISAAPMLDFAAAVRSRVGDDMAYHLYVNNKQYQDKVVGGISELTAGKIAKGGYSIQGTFDDLKRSGRNDGTTNRQQIDITKEFIQNPEKLKDKAVQGNAVEHLFGPENRNLTEQVLAASGYKAATGFFTSVTDPKTVDAIGKMESKYKTMFTTWAESAWPGVYQTEATNANQTTENYKSQGNLTLKFDPGSGKFQYTGKFGTPTGLVAAANGKLDGFNAAIGSMKRIWDMNGENDVTAKLYQYLPIAGIEPGTPIYRLIQEEYDKANKKAEVK